MKFNNEPREKVMRDMEEWRRRNKTLVNKVMFLQPPNFIYECCMPLMALAMSWLELHYKE